jgi:hypothetical protein
MKTSRPSPGQKDIDGRFEGLLPDNGYAKQTAILRDALERPDHALNAVLDFMREREQGTLYLSGTRLDSDFCFGSSDIGILLMVMPEASRKASTPGYHPHSAELHVAFQGQLTMECLEGGDVRSYTAAGDETLTIPRGRCHRARVEPSTVSSSLIIKTNLGDKPGVVRCDSCEYFADVGQCPLHQRWKAESQIGNAT